MSTADVPIEVWRSVGVDLRDVREVEVAPFRHGTGAASRRIELITVTLTRTDEPQNQKTLRLVRKALTPLRSGPHATGSRSSSHWANWRRELTAYRSGILPHGPGLRAPRLISVIDDDLYIEYVGDEAPAPEVAALSLGRWQHRDQTIDQTWLAQDQLAQRIAVTRLDWSSMEIDRRLVRIWSHRHQMLTKLSSGPQAIAHGDFSIGNLRRDGTDVVALDWATLGVSPVGFDLAHLALATLDEHLLPTYLDGLRGRFDAASVGYAYRASVGLIGASRAHWMTEHSIRLPAGFVDFVVAHAPWD